MEITSTSRELTKEEKYLCTLSPSIISVQNLDDGDTMEVSASLTFDDENHKGEVYHMLSVLGYDATGNLTVWSSQSTTFKRSFSDIASIYDDGTTYTIKKISGITKAGKPYVNCDLQMTR